MEQIVNVTAKVLDESERLKVEVAFFWSSPGIYPENLDLGGELRLHPVPNPSNTSWAFVPWACFLVHLRHLP
jgi:hypothetical protein